MWLCSKFGAAPVSIPAGWGSETAPPEAGMVNCLEVSSWRPARFSLAQNREKISFRDVLWSPRLAPLFGSDGLMGRGAPSVHGVLALVNGTQMG